MMEKALRKARSDLALSGIGSIAFGGWYFVKTLLYNLFARNYIYSILGLDSADETVQPIVMALWLLSSGVTMVLYLYVGLCAFREGRGMGRRRRTVYLLLAAGLLLGNGTGLISAARSLGTAEGALLDRLCDMMMEAARLVNMAALLRSAIRTRKQIRKSGQEATAYAD